MKRLPIGIDDFREVRRNYYFVDKSLFIKDITDHAGMVTLCTRPRRFGKTLNMSMLYYFFSLDNSQDKEGLFQNLLIRQEREAYQRHQGNYPTIFLSLKGVKADTWDDCYKLLRDVVQREYLRHKYLLDSSSIDREAKNYIRRIMDLSAEPYEYQLSLRNLTEYLFAHHGRKAVVLLDEYDVPVQQGFSYAYYPKVILFLRVWLTGALKGNTSLAFAVLTGVLRIAKESVFSDLNNLWVDSVVSGMFSTAFGFTTAELQSMAQEFQAEEKLSEIKAWYDGYRFGQQEIYNPWSVLNYFHSGCQAAPYWLNTSDNQIVRELLEHATDEMRQELTVLMNGKRLETILDESVSYPDIYKRKDALYTMLLMTGYLTIAGVEELDGMPLYALDIPNREVRQAYRQKVMDILSEQMDIHDSALLLRSLLQGRAEDFSKRLQDMLSKMMSYYDANGQDRESFYHGLMLGLTSLLGRSYQVRSNRESGLGRFDLAIYPFPPCTNGVLMEFKASDHPKDLDRLAKEALRQIEENGYDTEMKSIGVQQIQKYGIAFCGKQCCVAANSTDLA